MSGVLKTVRYRKLQKKCGLRSTKITVRQGEVLKAIWRCGMVKGAASELKVSTKTIESTTAYMRYRLGFPYGSIIDLIRWGVRSGLLTLLTVFLSGCQIKPLPVKNPPIPPMPAPRARLTASVNQGRKNYYLTWTYPQKLPVTGLNFVVLQSNKTSGAWSQLLITNQPPVLLSANQPAQYFKVYPTNSASVTLAWTSPDEGLYAYVLSAGPNSGNYTVTANSPVTNITITAVWPTNFYCVKAVDTNNLSSVCSNELAYSLPPVFPVSGLAVIRQ